MATIDMSKYLRAGMLKAVERQREQKANTNTGVNGSSTVTGIPMIDNYLANEKARNQRDRDKLTQVLTDAMKFGANTYTGGVTQNQSNTAAPAPISTPKAAVTASPATAPPAVTAPAVVPAADITANKISTPLKPALLTQAVDTGLRDSSDDKLKARLAAVEKAYERFHNTPSQSLAPYETRGETQTAALDAKAKKESEYKSAIDKLKTQLYYNEQDELGKELEQKAGTTVTNPNTIKMGTANQLKYPNISAIIELAKSNPSESAIVNSKYGSAGSNYNFLTDAQKNTILYYASKGEYDNAEKYYKTIERGLNAQYTQKFTQEVSNFSENHPVLGTVLSPFANAAGGVGGVISLAQKGINTINEAITGRYTPIDINAAYMSGIHSNQAVKSGVTNAAGNVGAKIGGETGENVARFLAGAALSSIDSTANFTLFGGASLALMGSAAMGDTIVTAIQSGKSENQAFAQGIINGLIEVATEKLPFDKWSEMVKGGAKPFTNFLKNTVKMGLTEFGEEAVGSVAQTAADILINGDKSDFYQYYYGEIKDGADKNAAAKGALTEFFIKQPALDGLAGFISGAGMGAVGTAIGKLNTAAARNKYYKEIGTAVKESGILDTLIRDASKVERGSLGAYKIQQIVDKVKSGAAMTAEEIGELNYYTALNKTAAKVLPTDAIINTDIQNYMQPGDTESAINAIKDAIKTYMGFRNTITETPFLTVKEKTDAINTLMGKVSEMRKTMNDISKGQYTAAEKETARSKTADTESESFDISDFDVSKTTIIDADAQKYIKKATEVLKKYGINGIETVKASDGVRGWYDPTNKTVYISDNQSTREAISYTLSHELVHDAVTKDAGLVTDIIDFAANMVDIDAEHETLRTRYNSKFESMGKEADEIKSILTDDYLNEEIAADYVMKVLENDDIIKQIEKQDGNLFTKIVDAFKRLYSRITGNEYVGKEYDLPSTIRGILQEQVGKSTAETVNEESTANANKEYTNEYSVKEEDDGIDYSAKYADDYTDDDENGTPIIPSIENEKKETIAEPAAETVDESKDNADEVDDKGVATAEAPARKAAAYEKTASNAYKTAFSEAANAIKSGDTEKAVTALGKAYSDISESDSKSREAVKLKTAIELVGNALNGESNSIIEMARTVIDGKSEADAIANIDKLIARNQSIIKDIRNSDATNSSKQEQILEMRSNISKLNYISDLVRGGEYAQIMEALDDAKKAKYNKTAKSGNSDEKTQSGEVKYSLDDGADYAPVFYSQMARVIDGYKGDKIAVNGLVSYLKSKGVKADEIKWSGIEEYINGKKSVTKEELLLFTRDNDLKIKEIEKSDKADEEQRNKKIEYVTDYARDYYRLSENDDGMPTLITEDGDLIAEILEDEDGYKVIEYYEYGDVKDETSYDELGDAEDTVDEIRDKKIDEMLENYEVIYDAEDVDAEQKFGNWRLDGGSNYREILFTLPNVKGGFFGDHWDEKNVVAHTRLQDFNDNSDGKVLFIEELQSDWHETGREKGYETAETIEKAKQFKNEQRESSKALEKWIKDNAGENVSIYNFENRSKYEELRQNSEYQRLNNNANEAIKKMQSLENLTLSAPYSETWHEFLLKRILRYAAEDGYDKIAWTTGAMQSERYGLAKKIESLESVKRQDGKYNVTAYGADGKVINELSKKGVAGEEVTETYGADLGGRLVKGSDNENGGIYKVEGKGLEIGGEGMKNFYDVGGKSSQNVPRFLNKYVKQWGTQVGETDIESGGETYTVPSVDITDAMKKGVLHEGQAKFSLSEPIEESRDLIAVHNLNESKLKESLEIGGLAMPSIAIVKSEQGHTNFGDISLIFRKDTINPTDKRNKIYGADAWTPSRPDIGYKLNAKVLKSFESTVESVSKENPELQQYLPSDYEDEIIRKLESGNGDITEAYKYSNRMKLLYAMKNIKDFEPLYIEKEYKWGKEPTKAVGELLTEKNIKKPTLLEYDDILKLEPEVRSALISGEETYSKIYSDDNPMPLDELYNLLSEAAKLNKQGAERQLDEKATNNKLKEVIDESKYIDWLNKTFEGIVEKKGIRNNADFFTASGNRKSFEALHMEYNLDSIIKAMSKGEQKGTGGFAGINSVAGAASKEYKSIKNVKADENRLRQLNEKEYEQIRSKHQEQLHKIIERMTEGGKNSDNYFIASDNAGKEITMAMAKNWDSNRIVRELSPYFNMDTSIANDIIDLKKELSNIPVNYFEAKPARAVGFDEVAAAVVPSSTDSNIISKLEKNGVPVIEYDKSNREERIEAINNYADKIGNIKFSLEDEKRAAAENKRLRPTVKSLESYISDLEDMKANAGFLHKEILPKNSDLNTYIDTLFKRVSIPADAMYETMANGADADVTMRDWVKNQFTNIYRYIYQGNETSSVDLEKIAKRVSKIARELIDSSLVKDDKGVDVDNLNDIKAMLRGVNIYIPESARGDAFEKYGKKNNTDGYNEFRKSAMGTVTFVSNRSGYKKPVIGVDALYMELSDLYPAVFPPELNGSHESELAVAIVDNYKNYKNAVSYGEYYNPYQSAGDNNYKAAADELTHEILEAIPGIARVQNLTDYWNEKITDARQEERDKARDNVDRLLKAQAKRNEMNVRLNYNNFKSETSKIADKANTEIRAQREYYQEQIKKVRERRDEQIAAQKQYFKDQKAKLSDRQKASTYSAQARQTLRKISAELARPNDKKHVPTALSEAAQLMTGLITLEPIEVEALPEGINQTEEQKIPKNEYVFNGTNLRTVGAALQKIVTNDSLITVDDTLFEWMREAETLKGAMRKMNSYDAQLVNNIVKGFNHVINNYNTAIINSRKENALDLAYNVIAQNQTANGKDKNDNNKLLKLADQFINNDTLTPITFFKRTGETMNEVFRQFLKGQDKQVRHLKEAVDYMTKLTDKIDITEWGKKNSRHVISAGGAAIDLTPAQIMDIYLIAKQPDGMRHLTKGGFIRNTDVKGQETTRNPFRLTEKQVTELTDLLTADQKRVADGMGKFLETTSEWGNEVSQALYGYDKFTGENYFPLKPAKDFIKGKITSTSNEDLAKTVNKSLQNLGFTKERVINASNPLTITSAFDVFNEHVNQMSAYNAYVIPMDTMKKVYDYVNPGSQSDVASADGVEESLEILGKITGKERKAVSVSNTDARSVKAAIAGKLGSNANRYIARFINDVNGGNISENNERGASYARFFIRNFKASQVAANLSTALKQPTSKLRAMEMINPKYFTPLTHKGIKSNTEEMLKYSQIAQIKDWGYSGTGNSKGLQALYNAKSENSFTKFQNKLMWAAGKMDEITWAEMWNAVKNEVAAKTDIEKGTSEYFEKVNERFRDVIGETQVVDSIFDTSDIMKSKNDLVKMSTAFMGEPLKTWNTFYSAVTQWNNDKTLKNAAQIGRTALMTVFNALLTGAISAIAGAYRDDEDESELGVKGFVGKIAMNTLMNAADDMATMLPYIRDIYEIFQGYDVKRIDMQGLSDLVKTLQSINNDGGSKTDIGKWRDVIYSIGTVTGVPVKTVMHDFVESPLKIVAQWSNNDLLEYEIKKMIYDIDSPSNRSGTKNSDGTVGRQGYYDILAKSYLRYDTDAYFKIKADMLEHGIQEAQIKTALKKAISGQLNEIYAKSTSFKEFVEGARAADIEEKKYPVEALKELYEERLKSEIKVLYELFISGRQEEFKEMRKMLTEVRGEAVGNYVTDALNDLRAADVKKDVKLLAGFYNAEGKIIDESKYNKLRNETIGKYNISGELLDKAVKEQLKK
jgi:hypothetical protein